MRQDASRLIGAGSFVHYPAAFRRAQSRMIATEVVRTSVTGEYQPYTCETLSRTRARRVSNKDRGFFFLIRGSPKEIGKARNRHKRRWTPRKTKNVPCVGRTRQ